MLTISSLPIVGKALRKAWGKIIDKLVLEGDIPKV